jgi:CcmD family protein
MIVLAIVPLVVWVGVFIYLFMLDRKLSQTELTEKDVDDL